jgi:hypothetical protein
MRCRILAKPAPAALVLLTLASGCTSHDIVTTASRPGKFRFFNCNDLNKRGVETANRERELAELIRRAEQTPGGKMVSSLAYRSEYNIALSDLREIELTATEKKCVLTHQPISEKVVR